MPYNTLFPGQQTDEDIIYVLHRHWWVLFKIIFIYTIFILLPPVINYFVQNDANLNGSSSTIILNLFASLYYFFVVTLFFRAWLDYYLDMWVVTSERIVNIEQKGLFSRKISSFKLYRVQDVTSEVSGLLPTFLHYGNVRIQTAGAKEDFIFKQISSPYEITKNIIKLVNWKKKTLAEHGGQENE